MEMTASKSWEKIQKMFKKKVDEMEFNTFFKNVEATDLSNNKLVLTCKSNLVRQNVEKYKEQFEEYLELMFDEEIKVEFVVKKEIIPQEVVYHHKVEVPREKIRTGLNAKNRLDNFVVGENSKLAFNACLAVVENPTPVYNPLFIYGGSGLGKTHLMQAVGNAILERNPNKRVYYSTSEEFSNEFFKVLQEGRIQHFRDKFRALDVLLLDDIQFFEKVFGRGEGTVEEEFFHTFNKLQELGKQIIMISDRYPKEIKNLSKRLESRFLSGLSVEIQQPGFETRMMILRNIAQTQEIEISDSILEYISDSVHTNVRELEGILTHLNARSKLLNEKITLEQVQEMISNNAKREESKVSAKKVIEMISTEYNVSVADMKSKKRLRKIVDTRQITMYLLKNNDKLGLSLTAIGGLLGGKDHSTVISSIRKIEAKVNEDVTFRKEIETLRRKIFR